MSLDIRDLSGCRAPGSQGGDSLAHGIHLSSLHIDNLMEQLELNIEAHAAETQTPIWLPP